MKCPKCGYLGFEAVDRCRNCGYDFSLAEPVEGVAAVAVAGAGVWMNGRADPDLPMRVASTPHPLDDLALLDAATQRPRFQPFSDVGPDLDRLFGDASEFGSGDSGLPLSGSAINPTGDDVPMITRPSAPRPPLAVRRSTPEVPRLRAEPARLPSLDLESEPPPSPHPMMQSSSYVREASIASGIEPGSGEDADLGPRIVAGVIDLLVLAAIDIVVLYFTAQICGVSISELNLLPKAPLAGFLFVQNIGYLIAFTAGGQTLGKMAAGIRVVASESDAVLDLGRACVRTVLWVFLAVPAGLGLLTTVLSRDHRGLHDRLAGTRVVR
ncbi:MAG TPA: RDD family protein [Vicinamibacterales bacterium]|nr:RDD family protein [Vicinamibacterales bacterium]